MENGYVIVRRPVWSIAIHETRTVACPSRNRRFSSINDTVGDELENINDDDSPEVPSDFFANDELADELQEPWVRRSNDNDFTQDETDNELSTEVNVPRDGGIATGRVARRTQCADVLPIGK